MLRKQRFAIQFVTLLVIGTIIFLVTNAAIAGAVLPAIHAGWRSFRTGVWIIQSDQHRRRARICAAFCLATAFWKAATGAFVSVLVFIVVAYFTGNAPDMNRFAATMLTLAGGVAVTTLLGLTASLAAVTFGIRVWVHPRLREMVHDDLQEVVNLPVRVGFNHAIFVLATSLAFPVMAVCCYFLIEFVSTPFTLGVMATGLIVVILGYLWLSPRIIAMDPGECWV